MVTASEQAGGSESGGRGRSAENVFAAISEGYRDLPEVTTGTGFGSRPGLRRRGKIFAMFGRDSLVVKLARNRAAAIVDSGEGVPFDPGHGRLMRDWVEVSLAHADDWPELVAEAFQYLGA